MAKIIILLFAIFLFSFIAINFVSADTYIWCYQPNANVSSGCGGTVGGGYFSCSGTFNGACKDGYDQNWNTNVEDDPTSEADSYVYATYYKPKYAVSSSFLTIADTDYFHTPQNLSIPSACWNASNTTLQFQFQLDFYLNGINFMHGGHIWSCWNGVAWLPFEGTISASNTHFYLYDNAMTWRVQVVNPQITITSPTSMAYSINNSLPLNYTYSSFASGYSCKYKVTNSTNYDVVGWTNINCGTNTTFSVPRSDTYNLTFYSNDSLAQNTTVSVGFLVSLEAPVITLDYPKTSINGGWLNNNSNFEIRFTPTDPKNISRCTIYGDWNNATWMQIYNFTNLNSGQQYSYPLSRLAEGTYHYNIWCNDSAGYTSWAYQNMTFNVDKIYPTLGILDPLGQKTSKIVPVKTNVTDNNVNNYCYYWIMLGASKNVLETQYDCNSTSAVVTNDGDFVFWTCVNDTANNQVCGSSVFSVNTVVIPPNGGGGGGGGGSIIIVKGQNGTLWTMQTDSGTGLYQLSMVKGSSRTKNILLKNSGTQIVNLNFTCQKDLCDGLKFDKTELGLPTGLEIQTQNGFTLTVPQDTVDGSYITNIIATDQDGNQGLITVQTTVGNLGILTGFIAKLTSSKDMFGIGVPYLLIFFFGGLIIGVLVYIPFLRERDGGAAISFIIGLIGGIAILIFV